MGRIKQGKIDGLADKLATKIPATESSSDSTSAHFNGSDACSGAEASAGGPGSPGDLSDRGDLGALGHPDEFAEPVKALSPLVDASQGVFEDSLKPKPSSSTSLISIWHLVWPQALMMMFQFLAGIIAVTVAGHINPHVQAAFGYITQCLFFLLVVGIAIANGGVAAMSQALGAKLPMRATRYVGLLVKASVLLGVIFLVLAYAGRHGLMWLLQVPDDVRPLTLELWSIFLFLIPAQIFTTMSMAIFRSRKQVMIPLLVSVVVCVFNVFGDLGLGLGMFGMPNLGGRGIVLASLVALYTGAFVNLCFLIRYKILGPRSFAPMRWQKKALPYVAKVALPSGGLQVLWQLGYMLLFSITSTLPLDSISAVAGLTVGLRIEGMMFLPTMAFSATASILVGHSLGAGNKLEARDVGVKVICAGVLFMSSIGVVLYQFIPEMSALVAQDSSVRNVAALYLRYNILAVPFTGMSMIISGIMTGAGANIYTLFIYSGATWLVRLPLAWYLGHRIFQDASGVFIAMLASQVVQASIGLFVLFRCDWYRFASTAKRFSRGTS